VKRVFPFVSVLAVAFGLCFRTPAQISIGVTPEWLTYLGNGSAGAFSCTSGFCGIDDEHWYSSFNVSVGATALVHAGNSPGIIRSTGACTVAGTVANTPNIDNATGESVQGDFGGSGGGGGGGTTYAGQVGFSTVGNGWVPVVSGGTAGAIPGGSGGNGATPVFSQYHPLLSAGSFWPAGGSLGGVGGGLFAGPGHGGNGGGPIIMVCQSINFTGTIDVSGGAGKPPTGNNSGAGGGGGAGYVILSTANWVANTGTFNLAGGAGGTCLKFTGCGAGGNGGNGWSIAITIQ
jgi:hypothetical protein